MQKTNAGWDVPCLRRSLISGRSLAEQLGTAGPMDQNQLLDLAHDILSALAAIHHAGLVHLDLRRTTSCSSPARRASSTSASLHGRTRRGGWAEPRLLHARALDDVIEERDFAPAADIFKLGVTLSIAAGVRLPDFWATDPYGEDETAGCSVAPTTRAARGPEVIASMLASTRGSVRLRLRPRSRCVTRFPPEREGVREGGWYCEGCPDPAAGTAVRSGRRRELNRQPRRLVRHRPQPAAPAAGKGQAHRRESRCGRPARTRLDRHVDLDSKAGQHPGPTRPTRQRERPLVPAESGRSVNASEVAGTPMSVAGRSLSYLRKRRHEQRSEPRHRGHRRPRPPHRRHPVA